MMSDDWVKGQALAGGRPMVDKSVLYRSSDEYFRLDGSVRMRLTRAAGIEVTVAAMEA